MKSNCIDSKEYFVNCKYKKIGGLNFAFSSSYGSKLLNFPIKISNLTPLTKNTNNTITTFILVLEQTVRQCEKLKLIVVSLSNGNMMRGTGKLETR